MQRVAAVATAVGIAVLIVVSLAAELLCATDGRRAARRRATRWWRSRCRVSAGKDFSTERIAALASSSEIEVDLPPKRPAELYVWAHRPTRDGDDEPLPVQTLGPAPDHLILVTKPGPA